MLTELQSPGSNALPGLGSSLSDRGRRIQELVEQIEQQPDSSARDLLQTCLQSVLSLYGDGLAHILEIVRKTEPGGEKILAQLLRDDLLRGLLLIHSLHPTSLEERLREGLGKIRPYLKSHGGNVELLSLTNDFAVLRLEGNCQSCPSSNVTLELAVRRAVEEACPDLLGFELEGTSNSSFASPEPQRTEARTPSSAAWIELFDAVSLEEGALVSAEAAGVPLIVCRSNSQFYAYRDQCPACNLPLHLGKLEQGTLRCGLGHGYDVQRAGRSLENSRLHLGPFPLLVEEGRVRVLVK